MRIISGEYRSRRLTPPPDSAVTRPIPDRVKEALFNLLRGHFEDAVVVDVFSGTGSIGLETLSRGARSCTFVERDPVMADVLQKNIDTLGCTDRARVLRTDALGASLVTRLDTPIKLLFFDPPYPMVRDAQSYERLARQFTRLASEIVPGGFAMLRTPWPIRQMPEMETVEVDLTMEGLDGPETHVYRNTALQLYAPAEGSVPST